MLSPQFFTRRQLIPSNSNSLSLFIWFLPLHLFLTLITTIPSSSYIQLYSSNWLLLATASRERWRMTLKGSLSSHLCFHSHMSLSLPLQKPPKSMISRLTLALYCWWGVKGSTLCWKRWIDLGLGVVKNLQERWGSFFVKGEPRSVSCGSTFPILFPPSILFWDFKVLFFSSLSNTPFWDRPLSGAVGSYSDSNPIIVTHNHSHTLSKLPTFRSVLAAIW